MSGLIKFLKEAFFPEKFTCDICGVETFGDNLCPQCRKTVSFNNGTVCPVCGRKNAVPEICTECKAVLPKFEKAVSPLVYENGTVALIAKFKNGEGYLKEYFAELIEEKLAPLPRFDGIVYVPMTAKAERKRGYNQSKLLAESVSKRLGVPVILNAVVKTADTDEQKTLTRKERAENLKSCFKVEKREEIKGKSVLLVDDVMTTGATADALCERLLKASAKKVYFAAVASVEFKIKKKDKN